MTVAILSLWQLPHCHYGSCHLVMIRLPCILKELRVFAKDQYKNTIKWSRQPFWYILFLKASWRKSAINLHQFILFTFFRFACTTQNFQGKKVCRVRNQTEENATKTLAVASMDHSPGWRNICCLGEEKWSARKQLI